jgi:ATP-dependent RNA helicase SUPV3L1/SUV3
VIFTTLQKWNGKDNVLLTISQIKQIGGRAGRFGTHADDTVTAGSVTTVYSDDLPLLKLAMDSPLPALPSAFLAPNTFVLETLYTALPPQTGLETLYKLLMDLAVVREPYSLSDLAELLVPASTIDQYCPDLPIRARALLSQVPMDWRDHELVQAFQSMLRDLVGGVVCDPAVLAGHFLGILKEVEMHQLAYTANKEAAAARIVEHQAEDARVRENPLDGQYYLPLNQASAEAPTLPDPPSMPLQTASNMLMKLEVLHKLLVAYAWLSFRFPMTFGMKESADDMKNRAETAIEFCLECIRVMKKKAQKGRVKVELQGILQPVEERSFPRKVSLVPINHPGDCAHYPGA